MLWFETHGTYIYSPEVSVAGGDDMGTGFGRPQLSYNGLFVFLAWKRTGTSRRNFLGMDHHDQNIKL
jgi:hypothetical protein